MAITDASASPATASARFMTAEELLRLPTGMGERYDLVEGELRRMSLAGSRHGRIVSRINSRIEQIVERNHLGSAFGAETGFILSRNPDTVRAPDIAFVAAARLPQGELPDGFLPLAPDLAVEVISPSETAAEVQSKASQYFEGGTRQVWIVYPGLRQVVVFRSARQGIVLLAADTLDGGDLLPGFACRVSELFE